MLTKDRFKALMCVITGEFCEKEGDCRSCNAPEENAEEVRELIENKVAS